MPPEFGGGGSIDDLVTTAKFRNQVLGGIITALGDNNTDLVTALTAIATAITNTWPRVTGSFTCGAAATTVVSETDVTVNSLIFLSPTNAAAGTLQGSVESLYISAISAGVSFTVATAAGTAAGGTETFDYMIVEP